MGALLFSKTIHLWDKADGKAGRQKEAFQDNREWVRVLPRAGTGGFWGAETGKGQGATENCWIFGWRDPNSWVPEYLDISKGKLYSHRLCYGNTKRQVTQAAWKLTHAPREGGGTGPRNTQGLEWLHCTMELPMPRRPQGDWRTTEGLSLEAPEPLTSSRNMGEQPLSPHKQCPLLSATPNTLLQIHTGTSTSLWSGGLCLLWNIPLDF